MTDDTTYNTSILDDTAAVEGIEEIGILTTDIPGQLHRKNHPVRPTTSVERALTQRERISALVKGGATFDASSLRGLNDIEQSDMNLVIDTTGIITKDPFSASVPSILAFGAIHEPETRGNAPYQKDPRGVAKRAEAYLKDRGMTAYIGPEIEFFLFNSIHVHTEPHNQYVRFKSDEGAWNGEFHAISPKRGYFPIAPLDKTHDARARITQTLERMGVECEAHHHEVAGPGQAEVNTRFAPLVRMADTTQLYRYVVRMVAKEMGYEAIFLPKPFCDDNGNGMHVNLSIWSENGKNLFAGDGYALLSDTGRHAIGGVLAHIASLSGLANPTTNSSRRFAKGFEAPVLAVYGSRNRSAAIRIPSYHTSPQSRRIEARFPDPTANPYLLYPALVMAMVDGIERRIEPGAPMEHDVYLLPQEELRRMPAIPRSLDARLDALDRDREYLLRNGVFNDGIIDSFLDVAGTYAAEVERWPSPREFKVYAGWN